MAEMTCRAEKEESLLCRWSGDSIQRKGEVRLLLRRKYTDGAIKGGGKKGGRKEMSRKFTEKRKK